MKKKKTSTTKTKKATAKKPVAKKAAPKKKAVAKKKTPLRRLPKGQEYIVVLGNKPVREMHVDESVLRKAVKLSLEKDKNMKSLASKIDTLEIDRVMNTLKILHNVSCEIEPTRKLFLVKAIGPKIDLKKIFP